MEGARVLRAKKLPLGRRAARGGGRGFCGAPAEASVGQVLACCVWRSLSPLGAGPPAGKFPGRDGAHSVLSDSGTFCTLRISGIFSGAKSEPRPRLSSPPGSASSTLSIGAADCLWARGNTSVRPRRKPGCAHRNLRELEKLAKCWNSQPPGALLPTGAGAASVGPAQSM